MNLPHGITVTVLRRAARDRHGDGSVDVSHTVSPCAVDWNATASTGQFRDVQETDVDLFVPRAADVLATDKIELPDGSTFNVVGRPMWDQVHPMTGTDFGFKLVRLREVSGA